MPSADALVDSLLLPGLSALAEVDPAAARERRRRMAGDAAGFLRGSLVLHGAWLAAHPLPGAPWVWALGDAHAGNFSTLATGALGRDGVSPVTYGAADIDDELPTPWHWDLLRLLASVALILDAKGPRSRGFGELAIACIADYERIMRAAHDGDEHVERLDYHGLPEALKAAIERDAEPAALARHRRALIAGARLRSSRACGSDPAARRLLLPAIAAALQAAAPAKDWELLDLARRTVGGGLASLGRRRWWVLARERDRAGAWVPRVLELKEHRPSALAGVLPAQPFAPAATRPWTLPMGGDPWQRWVPLGTGQALLRTRCQARTVLDLAAMDRGDRIRLGRLWGQLVARAHLASARALGQDVAGLAEALAGQAHEHAAMLGVWACELATWTRAAHRRFRRKA